MANRTTPFIGGVYGKNVTDNDAVIMFPTARAMPRDPDSVGYLGLSNASAYPSVCVFGMLTPFFTITVPAKASWFTAAMINDFVFDVDAENNTDEWAWCFYDGSTIDYGDGANGKRIYEGCRCSSISVRMGTNGSVLCDLTFFAKYGDRPTTDDGTPYQPARPAYTNVFDTLAGTPDAGQAYGVRDVLYDAGAGISHVASAGFTLNRGQGHILYMNGTYFPTEVGSGMFSGDVSVEQSPTGTATLTSLGIAIGKRLAAEASGVNFALTMKRNERVQDHDIGNGRVVRSYTLINTSTGGNPAVVTAKTVAA
jgi:hypothetical protein